MQALMIAGMTLGWRDYQELPAIVWSDLLLWKEAEIVKSNKDNEK